MQKIIPFLWMDNNGEEAANFYISTFKGGKLGRIARFESEGAKVSGQPEGSVMGIDFEIEGFKFSIINGGPMFKKNQSISFFVNYETSEEIDALWNKLLPGGKVMMELGKYPYSERYGWIQDKFGVSWQLMCGKSMQTIVPSLLFVNEKYGKAQEAIDFYVSVFPGSSVTFISKATGDGPEPKGAVQYSTVSIFGQTFVIMEGMGKHEFDFNEGVSLLVDCESQEEIDTYANKLSVNPDQEQCGWLKDKFGVSWQIFPYSMIGRGTPDQSKRMFAAMLKMKRIDMAELQKAFEGA